MLRLKILLCSLFLIGFQFKGAAQGMEFATGTWAEIVQQARKENKAIFVDVYTEWCGPCKVMAATVFTVPEVGEKYNNRYINVKIDAEKGDGIAFAKKYDVQAYPTYFFIDPATEELIGRSGASMTIQNFKDLSDEMWNKYMGKSEMSLEEMKVQFKEKKSLDNDFMQVYIKKVKGDKRSLIEALHYYMDHFVLQNYTEDNVFFLASNFTQGDTRVYDYLITNYATVDPIMRKRDGIAAANVDRTLNYELNRNLGFYLSNSKLSDTERKKLLEECYAIIRQVNAVSSPDEAEKAILENQRAYYKREKDKVKELAVFKEYINKYVLPNKHTANIRRQTLVLDKNNHNPVAHLDSVHAASSVRMYAEELLKIDSSAESLKLANQLLDKSQALTAKTLYYNNIKNLIQYNFADQKKAIKAQSSLVKQMTKKKDPYLQDAAALLDQMNAKEANLKFVAFRK